MNLGQVIGAHGARGVLGGPTLEQLESLRTATNVRSHSDASPVQAAVTVSAAPRRRYSPKQVEAALAKRVTWTVAELAAVLKIREQNASHWLRRFEDRGALVRTEHGRGRGGKNVWEAAR